MNVKVIPQEVEVIVKSPEKVVVEMTREEAFRLRDVLRYKEPLYRALRDVLTP